MHAGAVLRGQGVQERLADRVPVLREQRVAEAHHGRAGVVRVGRPGRGYLRGDHLAGDRVKRVVHTGGREAEDPVELIVE